MHLSRHLDHLAPLNFRFKYASYIRRCFCSFRSFSTPSSAVGASYDVLTASAAHVYCLKVQYVESYGLCLLPHTQHQGLIWPTLLHFVAMSSDASDAAALAAAYYYEYKSTVYDNLFVGIVYGEVLG